MDSRSHLSDAELALGHGEVAAALKAASAAADDHPAEAGLLMVRAHLSWNDLSSARSVLNRLIQKHPGEASTHLAAAYVALAEDRPADAARSALRAVNCDRFDVVVLATAAWLSYKG